MKTTFSVLLDVEVRDELRSKAQDYGVTVSDLTAMGLKYALGRITREAAQAYAGAQQSTRGRLSGGLTLAEQAVLAGLEKLKAEPENVSAWRQIAQDIASAAGLRLRDAYPALTRLQSRGMLEYSPGFGEADKWGRRPQSHWWLPADRKASEAKFAAEKAARLEAEARAAADKTRFEKMRSEITQEEIDAING